MTKQNLLARILRKDVNRWSSCTTPRRWELIWYEGCSTHQPLLIIVKELKLRFQNNFWFSKKVEIMNLNSSTQAEAKSSKLAPKQMRVKFVEELRVSFFGVCLFEVSCKIDNMEISPWWISSLFSVLSPFERNKGLLSKFIFEKSRKKNSPRITNHKKILMAVLAFRMRWHQSSYLGVQSKKKSNFYIFWSVDDDFKTCPYVGFWWTFWLQALLEDFLCVQNIYARYLKGPPGSGL